VCRRSGLLLEKGGGGGGRSQIIRRRESLIIFKSFNTLWREEGVWREGRAERVERGDEKKDEEEYSYVEEWRVEKKRLKR